MSKARDLANAGTALTTVSATELGYLDGVTSAVQTQVDAKIAKSTVTAKGDLLVGTGSGTVVAQPVGTNGQYLQADSTQADGVKWADVTTLPSQTGNSGKYLTTNGTAASWGVANNSRNWTFAAHTTSYNALTGNRSADWFGYPFTKVYYMGGYYIFGTDRGNIAYSTDGITWNYQIIFPTAASINGIAYNGTTWVVAGGSTYCYSGTPGGTWTSRTSQIGAGQPIYDVAWIGGSINLFILCGASNGASSVRVSSSPDGITWTSRYAPASTEDMCGPIITNTTQTTIMINNRTGIANNQGVYSTNGTSWTALPISASAVAPSGTSMYMPHIDRFVDFRFDLRQSPANIGTLWNTAPTNKQSRPTARLYAYSDSFSIMNRRALPIWDSTNSCYYAIDSNSAPHPILITFGNADPVGGYSTGSFTYYYNNIVKVEPIPVVHPSPGLSSSGTVDRDIPPSFGIGNGKMILAYANTANYGGYGMPTILTADI